ncbi:hypothetical protein ACFUKV_17605 [Streptomyces paradoxus]|uniref:hypothetical protein n=1 Tax=Streptomyces paradoxus TaxID=66375 RepID=UPI0036285D6C
MLGSDVAETLCSVAQAGGQRLRSEGRVGLVFQRRGVRGEGAGVVVGAGNVRAQRFADVESGRIGAAGAMA